MRGGAQQDPFQAGHPWPVSVLYVIPRVQIHFIWRKKPAMNSVAYKKERKQHETRGRRPSLVCAGLQRPGALSQFLPHRSKRESGVSEHALDPPRSMFSRLCWLHDSHPDVYLNFFLPCDEASQAWVCMLMDRN